MNPSLFKLEIDKKKEMYDRMRRELNLKKEKDMIERNLKLKL